MTSLEKYLVAMRERRGASVNETSYYVALANLCNEVGATLKPKVRYVVTPKGQGAGLPDGGLYTANQLRRGADADAATTKPERGCVEVKGLRPDVGDVAASEQVAKYLKGYGLVLVTNYRDFLLVGRDEGGGARELERYTLAASEREFWELAEHTTTAAKMHGERFAEYLKRVMLHAAPLASPEDVARFLASYARDARARVEARPDLPALQGLREALEQALGLKFEGERGEHFFRSTLVQTLFYGIFSAWVLWAQEQEREGKRRTPFNWKEAHWYLRVPMISALFNQLLERSKLIDLGLVEVLDWTGATLNRIEKPTEFIQKFTEGHAVQYFYEPFLQEFDPELRKQLGVWYTPREIVRYMVARVDTVLREELGVAEGLAGEEVYVLDPCCGTGTYLVEVLRSIEQTLEQQGLGALAGARLREAATRRVFGFEILPAPFVVAHLQLGLLLQTMGAALEEGGDERVGVFLTNALTGWEPPKGPKARLLFPELEQERDRAEEVKQKRPILVVIGNPPYNAFAGTSPEEEQGLVEPYKEGLIKKWGIKKFNLDDLYVRFFRIAERRIAETSKRGIVSFISNHSWVSDHSFVVLRENLLQSFDKFWIENMHGNRKITEYAPDGKTSETVFAVPGFSPGIKQGIVISLWIKTGMSDGSSQVLFRDDLHSAKAVERRAQLLKSLEVEDFNAQYEPVFPVEENRYSLRPANIAPHYKEWPTVAELCARDPINGPIERRGNSLVVMPDEISHLELLKQYLDPSITDARLSVIAPRFMKSSGEFNATRARAKLAGRTTYSPAKIVRYPFKPFDLRLAYLDADLQPLFSRPSPELLEQRFEGNKFLVVRETSTTIPDSPPFYFSTLICDYHCLAVEAKHIPMRLVSLASKLKSKDISSSQGDLGFSHTENTALSYTANLSQSVRSYLASLGVENPDADANDAALVWMHALAVGYSPAYLAENADGIRGDWPRVPLPASAGALQSSAALGREVANILAYDPGDPAASPSPLKGIVAGPLRAELRVVGVPSRVGGGQLGGEDFALAANWGYAGQNGVTMPGRGDARERDYTADERAAIEQGAAALNLAPEEAIRRLGATTYDVYLNAAAYWRCVPARVWDYYIGGYQVIKKWLSYRERALLGRPLTPDELSEVAAMARRLAALRLLEPALDANYQAVKADPYAWGAAATA